MEVAQDLHRHVARIHAGEPAGGEVLLADGEDLETPGEVRGCLRGPPAVAADLGPGDGLWQARLVDHERHALLERHLAQVERRVNDDPRRAEQRRVEVVQLVQWLSKNPRSRMTRSAYNAQPSEKYGVE